MMMMTMMMMIERSPTRQCRVCGPRGVLPSNRLMGMCRCMGSNLHDSFDYNGVAFSIELLEWGRTFS